MRKVRVFISFASEDARIRDLFVGQGRNLNCPWEIADWSAHEPFSEMWKTQMRQRIKCCHVALQLVGKDTYKADGAIWEINCALDEGLRAFGVWTSATDRGPVPSCFKSNNVIDWTWDGVAEMIAKATAKR